MVSGFLSCFELKSALAELRSTTCCLEAVLLTLLHTRIAGQVAGRLERGTVLLGVSLEQCARDAVADRTSLAGEAAAGYGALYVELAGGVRRFERLTANHLQGLETEVVVNRTVVDLDLTGAAREQTNAGNGGLSSAGAVGNKPS